MKEVIKLVETLNKARIVYKDGLNKKDDVLLYGHDAGFVEGLIASGPEVGYEKANLKDQMETDNSQ
jgi:hypothetical protein